MKSSLKLSLISLLLFSPCRAMENIFSTFSSWQEETKEALDEYLSPEPVYKPITRTKTNTSLIDVSTLTQTTTSTRKRPSIPTPPSFPWLTTSQKNDLINKAITGDSIAIKSLLEHVYWGAMDPLNLDDIRALDRKLVFSSRGHIYWHAIIEQKALSDFPGLEQKITDLAERGKLATAQYALGNIISKKTFSKNSDAVNWWQKAADQGFAPAQHSLGYAYFIGKGINKDKSRAVELFQAASDQGYLLAMNCLGRCYLFGKGVREDQAKAIPLLFYSRQKDSDIKHTLQVTEHSLDHIVWDEGVAINTILSTSVPIFNSFATEYYWHMLPNSNRSLSSYIVKFIESYRAWTQSFMTSLNALLTNKPGFFITCIEYNGDDPDPEFYRSYTFDEEQYISIGKANIEISNLWKNTFNLFYNVSLALQELKQFSESTKREHIKKLEKLYDLKYSLEALAQSNRLTELELEKLPDVITKHNIKLIAYENLPLDFSSVLETATLWVEAGVAINNIVKKYFKEGANYRNALFLDMFSYY